MAIFKSEIRISKSETISNDQNSNYNKQKTILFENLGVHGFEHLNILISDLFRISIFGFRISFFNTS